MTRSTHPAGRQRPSGAFGPVRDETRNTRIIEAVLDLIIENGYAELTMAAVAARAEVAKATVYRRWASREDLVADALESLMLPGVPAETTAAATLRGDLIATLTHSSACLQPQGRRFSAVLAAATGSHPQITDTLRERYIAGQREGIAACLHRAQQRDEITAERVEGLLAPDRLEIAAAVGVMVLQEDLLGAVLDTDGIARLVDQVLLPLIGATPTD
ncbi:TetR family transcriptional regulator [Streptomyces sp. MBT58]|uniref:TetR-like C-terminal domain-containing protein n=1 Tax=Streptomyces sp. MBT58 TaxID=1488389 RepID=UPI001914518F|nr:TetR-like C-terminal domain-containing protein [Streptomyces sp. MBT58]MBK5992935.1 TetR family transcriptional regulator [Streptomyces sp. MBT58]